MKKSATFDQRELLRSRAARWSEESLASVRQSLERQLDTKVALPVSREDLIGEVLLRILCSDPLEIQHPAAYARVILRNLIRDKIRELEKIQKIFEHLADRARIALIPTDHQPQVLEEGEFLQDLISKSELTETQERVIRLMYFEDLTLTEVARALSKNPGTIQRHHNRAIEKLSRNANRLEFEP